MSNLGTNMYNLIGKLRDVVGADKPAEPTVKETVYESVEPRGSITEAVKGLEAKFAEFNEGIEDKIEAAREKAAAAGKPIKDKETPKSNVRTVKGKSYGGSAQKDAEEKDDLDEGQGPYELYNPKHPKFKANYDKWMAKNPGKKLEDFLAAMKKREAKMNEAAYDEPAAPDAEAIAKRKRLQAIKDRQEEQGDDFGAEKNTPIRKVAGKAYGGAAQKDVEDKDDVDEDWYSDAAAKTTAAANAPKDPNDLAQQKADYKARDEQSRKELAAHSAHLQRKDYNNSVANNMNKVMDKMSTSGMKGSDVAQLGQSSSIFQPKDASGKAGNYETKPGDVQFEPVKEVAPPGAKAERMVKHIKKGYSKDGALTKREKGIAYATAWKTHNKGQVEEGVEFKDTVKNSTPKFKKAKVVKEGRDMTKSQYFDEQVALALAKEQPGLDTSSAEFREAVYNEIIAQGMTSKAARNIMLMDEDFLGDVATGYGYFCKHNAEVANECGTPVNSHLGGDDSMQELDEIAKLAGLTTEMDSKIPGDSDSPLTHTDACPVCSPAPCSCDHDVEEGNAFTGKLASTSSGKNFKLGDKSYKDTSSIEEDDLLPDPPAEINIDMKSLPKPEMDEGNEFSGALAAAKASGAKEFEVDGKKYTVKEDINVNITANGQEDALNLFRKLAGMDEVAAQPVIQAVELPQDAESAIAQGVVEPVEVEVDEEREIEYTNTPNEKIAPPEAAFPSGTDLNRAKKQYRKEYPGDNPMAVKEEALWKQYESMINDVKK